MRDPGSSAILLPEKVPSRASSLAPTRPSAPRAIPSPRSPESSTPRVRLHLKPVQKGTKQLLAQYDDRLICVRYRYDTHRKKRLKTAELIVAERSWEPPRPPFVQDRIVGVRVAFTDVATRDQVKAGWWHVEPGAKGLAATLRPRPQRPRAEGPILMPANKPFHLPPGLAPSGRSVRRR